MTDSFLAVARECWIPFNPDECWQGENVNIVKGGGTVDIRAVRTKSTVDVAVRSQ